MTPQRRKRVTSLKFLEIIALRKARIERYNELCGKINWLKWHVNQACESARFAYERLENNSAQAEHAAIYWARAAQLGKDLEMLAPLQDKRIYLPEKLAGKLAGTSVLTRERQLVSQFFRAAVSKHVNNYVAAIKSSAQELYNLGEENHSKKLSENAQLLLEQLDEIDFGDQSNGHEHGKVTMPVVSNDDFERTAQALGHFAKHGELGEYRDVAPGLRGTGRYT